jgi:hypothetical protein
VTVSRNICTVASVRRASVRACLRLRVAFVVARPPDPGDLHLCVSAGTGALHLSALMCIFIILHPELDGREHLQKTTDLPSLCENGPQRQISIGSSSSHIRSRWARIPIEGQASRRIKRLTLDLIFQDTLEVPLFPVRFLPRAFQPFKAHGSA